MTEDLYRSYRDVDPDGSGDTAAALFAGRHLLPHLAPFRAESVLEIGAGTGGTLRALQRAGFTRVSGVDLSASQVEAARLHGTDVALADGVAALAGQPAGSLGAVLALDVLEHLPLEALLELLGLVATRLRPGGVLVARVPNGEGLFGGAVLHGDLTHLRAFTSRSLAQAFHLRGLEPVATLPVRPMPHGLISGLRAVLWRLVEGTLRWASAAEAGRRDGIYTRNLVAVARRPR